MTYIDRDFINHLQEISQKHNWQDSRVNGADDLLVIGFKGTHRAVLGQIVSQIKIFLLVHFENCLLVEVKPISRRQ